MSAVTELEGVVLGIVGAEGPCTAYHVRRFVQASPSTHWSASAGAIYPLLDRLVEAGYVRSTADPDDGRGRAFLSLTTAGRKMLRSWVLSASEPQVAASIFDAVRTRVFFLDLLPAREQARCAKAMLAALEAFLQEALEYESPAGDNAGPLARMAARGAVHTARARVAWMREVVEATRTG